mmetsp:Transcript_43390/g.70286  ORF Transcript_43390/g.70286 Transcript_43390/m.70286 type:complete len:206 (-) Transcript_43390:1878-2495(-)
MLLRALQDELIVNLHHLMKPQLLQQLALANSKHGKNNNVGSTTLHRRIAGGSLSVALALSVLAHQLPQRPGAPQERPRTVVHGTFLGPALPRANFWKCLEPLVDKLLSLILGYAPLFSKSESCLPIQQCKVERLRTLAELWKVVLHQRELRPNACTLIQQDLSGIHGLLNLREHLVSRARVDVATGRYNIHHRLTVCKMCDDAQL